MTERPGVNPAAPEVGVPPQIACGAGTLTTIEVHVRHPGPRPAMLTVTVVGLDQTWVGEPVVLGPVEPGEISRLLLPVQPEPGAMGARYPFAVAVEATDLLGVGNPVMATAESTLVVDSRERVVVAVEPAQLTTVFGRRVQVRITNPARESRELTLSPTVAAGIALRLQATEVDVPPGRTVSVRGRLRVRRPRVFGGTQVHPYALAVRGQGAPVVVEGAVRARPLLRGALVKSVAVVLVVAVWAGLGIIAIPRIASFFASPTETTAGGAGAQPPASGSAAPTGGAAPGEGGAGSGADAGAADGAAGAEGGAGGSGGAAATGVRLRGVVTGPEAADVAVILVPTSLVEAAAAGAEPAPGVTDDATASGLRAAGGAFGKIPSWSVRQARDPAASSVSTATGEDGSFSIAGIQAPGLYLLTFARAGFQTQRFVVNAATLANADPMKVELKAGQGSLNGTVVSAGGPIGAATVSITDGTVALQTSTVSAGGSGTAGSGTPGSWNVTGLSTPGTYLVQAASPGFGTASSLVTLDAGGTAVTDLTLLTGVAAITGQVSGVDQLGRLGGLGGKSVAVTGRSGDVTTTRTATTVTAGPVGQFTLPDLPTPGDYTLTVSGPGYQDQVRQVSLAAGAGAVTLDITLTRADGVVSGTVFGDPATATKPDEDGVVGAGLTLTGPNVSFKTMSTSDPAGSFRFTGVPPGTYVLAGSMFGRVSSSVTVELVAAGEVTADLRLLTAADTELPATARIGGRVVDSRTGGVLTCDRAAIPVAAADCRLTASVPVPVIDPDTGRINPDLPAEIVSATSSPAEDYLLPAREDTAHPGLVPGLYTVTLTAPGYEPGTVNVQVGQGQVAPAPLATLVPLGMITGRLTTRAGQLRGVTCIVATPAGIPPTTDQTSCSTPDNATCVLNDADPAARCGLVNPDGSYQVRGLTHGGYTVAVLVTDREFLTPAPFDLQLELGSDARYDPVLDRLGQIAVRVLAPDLTTAELAPVTGATVTATGLQGAPDPLPPVPLTDDAGTVTLTGVRGLYDVAATGAGGTAIARGVDAQLNLTTTITLVLTEPIGPVVGRVVTNDGIRVVGVANARVHVTGIVGYINGAPDTSTVDLATDSHGCFAIVPTNADLTPTNTDCPTIGSSPAGPTVAAMPNGALIALPVSVTVDETDQTKRSDSKVIITGDGLVRTLPIPEVPAKPSSTAPLRLVSQPAGVPRAVAQISVLGSPSGAGKVGVQDNGDGTLTWTDPAVGGTNLTSPGLYTLRAALPGWATASAYVLCSPGANCTVVTSPTDSTPAVFLLVRNPTFSGNVTMLPPPPAGTTPASAVYSVAGASNVTVTADAAGVLTWQEAGAPANLVTPGTYTITASLTGYESQPVTINCPAGALSCSPAAITLSQPAQTTVTLVSTGNVAPVGAQVTLTGNKIGQFQVIADPTSTTVNLPPLSTFDTSYQLNVRAAGFATVTVGRQSPQVRCAGPGGPVGLILQPGPNTCTVTLQQLGRIPLQTFRTNPDDTNTKIALASVTITARQCLVDTSPCPAGQLAGPTFTIPATSSTGQGTITGTNADDGLIAGTYQITAHLDGYQDTVGTVRIVQTGAPPAYSIDLNLPTGGFPIDRTTGAVQILLPVTPVTLQVQLVNGGVPVLPPGTVEIRGGAMAPRACVIVVNPGTACTPPVADTKINSPPSISFANLIPSAYTVLFTSSDGRYRPVTVQVNVVTAVPLQQLTVPIDLKASTQLGTLFDAAGQPLNGVVVSLRAESDLEKPASDLDGAPLVSTTGAGGAPAGQFSFTKVPDLRYRAVAEVDGWDTAVSPTPIELNSALTTNPPPVTLRLTTRTHRDVTVTLNSTADAPGAPVNLAGAAVEFRPVSNTQPPLTPPNTTLSGFTATGTGTGPFTVSASQVPTGSWRVAVTPSGAPFGAYVSDPIVVAATARPAPVLPPDTRPQPPAIPASFTLVQAQATITVSWPSAAGCGTPPAGSLPIVLTRAGTAAPARGATVTANNDGSGSATLDVLLPPGDYTWAAQPTPAGWTGGTGTFSVPDAGSAQTVTSSGTLLPSQVPTVVSLTVGGTAVTGPVVATAPGGATTSGTTGQTMCLAPVPGWVFSVNNPTPAAGRPVVGIADRTVTITRPGPNTVAFTGFAFQPSVQLANVDGRSPDTTPRSVTLALSRGGTSLWSAPVTIPAGGTTAAGPALIVGAGPTTLTGTPPAGGPFGVGTQTIDASAAGAATVTLPYTAVMLTVTAQVGTTPRAGATVTLTPATGTGPPAGTTGPSGQVVFQDLPAGTYTVTAQAGTGAGLVRGTLTGQQFDAGVRAVTVTMVAAQ